MEKPEEYQIECYAREPRMVSREVRQKVEYWIERDNEIALLCRWYRDYYREVKLIEAENQEHSGKPSSVFLKPCAHQKRSGSHFILAAQTLADPAAEPSLRSIKTFESDDQQTLLRILHDPNNARLHLNVISEHLQPDDIVLVESLQKKDLFISKPGGKMDFPEDELTAGEVTGWRGCNVHLPLVKILLYKDIRTNVMMYSFHKKYPGIQLTINEDIVLVMFNRDLFRTIPAKMILYTDHSRTLFDIEDNLVRFSADLVTSAKSQLSFFQ